MDSLASHQINIPIGDLILKGILTVPNSANGLVIFSHGSGSSRLSTRNNFIANHLNTNGFSTLLFDLLTDEEDTVYEKRFDIALLTERLIEVTEWVQSKENISTLKLGYFGASTGAASALNAAAYLGSKIAAVVSRGGRPDLAGDKELFKVVAPTLFIVGGLDNNVIPLNQLAYDKMNTVKKLEIVPGATHLFEEPGKLDQVATLSVHWYKKYITE
ncbi:dienelactone hydrolase family protein [Echinicola shivajiensis]|uniref:dienelactone hydrolase family protein n=1 Tax=Echinicola shivajiensis TaxID=1035916 RepID=UPI001BFCB9EF|nr:dienelactone hydrolase family protein [Echinicola shivajiensis]